MVRAPLPPPLFCPGNDVGLGGHNGTLDRVCPDLRPAPGTFYGDTVADARPGTALRNVKAQLLLFSAIKILNCFIDHTPGAYPPRSEMHHRWPNSCLEHHILPNAVFCRCCQLSASNTPCVATRKNGDTQGIATFFGDTSRQYAVVTHRRIDDDESTQ